MTEQTVDGDTNVDQADSEQMIDECRPSTVDNESTGDDSEQTVDGDGDTNVDQAPLTMKQQAMTASQRSVATETHRGEQRLSKEATDALAKKRWT
jgi:hypothetical protein